MSNSAEEIEAKLAAYVDGELSGPEKAEIERHLASNPSHAALIKELIRHRTMVQLLPREDAPLDLTDNLQQQLEREVLLAGDVADEARAVVGRINRMPQYLSLAAMLLLTAGVGTAVFFMLPTRHPQGELARGGEAGAEKKSVETGQLPQAVKEKAAKDQTAFDETSSDRGRQMLAAKSRPEPEMMEFQARREAVAAKKNRPEQNLVTLAIGADDLAVAKTTLVGYLVTNNIDWRPGDESLLTATRLPEEPINLARMGEAVADGALYERKHAGDWDNVLRGGGGARGGGARGGGAAPGAATPPTDKPQVLAPSAQLARTFPESRPAVPSDPSSVEPMARSDAAIGNAAPPAPLVTQDMAKSAAFGGGALPATQPVIGSRVIVVRNLTARQIEELAAVMSQPQRRQFAALPPQLDRAVDKREEIAEQVQRKAMGDAQPIETDRALEAAKPPATQPAENRMSVAQGAIAQEAGAASRPATLPAGEMQQEAERLYDLVVVLRPNAPETRPTDAAAAEPAVPATRPARENASSETRPAN